MMEVTILSGHLSHYILPVPGFVPMSSVFLGECVTHKARVADTGD